MFFSIFVVLLHPKFMFHKANGGPSYDSGCPVLLNQERVTAVGAEGSCLEDTNLQLLWVCAGQPFFWFSLSNVSSLSPVSGLKLLEKLWFFCQNCLVGTSGSNGAASAGTSFTTWAEL